MSDGRPSDSGPVLVTRRNGVVELTLNRPRVRNAINLALESALSAALDEVARREEDRVVVLGGLGGAFCSGADLSDPSLDPMILLGRLNQFVLRLHRLPKPVIAKVGGPAVGAGCSIALCCDLVVASTAASFSEIFSQRGLALDTGSSWTLPRLVGTHRAREIAFFGDSIPAAEAAHLGLINLVVEPTGLDDAVHRWADRLAHGPAQALSGTKRLLTAGETQTMEESLELESVVAARQVVSSEAREALRAFRERRPPRFWDELAGPAED